MVVYYTRDKDLVEEYRLDRLKFDLIESQFLNQHEALETLRGFLKLYLRNGFSPIINIFGQTGIGKTWLLKYFLETSVKDTGINYIALDADDFKSALELIFTLANLIKIKFNAKLKNFEAIINTLRKRILDNIELKDGALLHLDKKDYSIYLSLSNAMNNVRRIYGDQIGFGEKIDLNNLSIKSLWKLLPIALAEDMLISIRDKKNVVMMIDSLSDDILYHDLIPILLASLLGQLFIVVSSKNKISWEKYSKNWIDPQNMISLQLQPFQSGDVDKFLETKLGISTEEFVENVIKVTKGRPLYLSLFVEYLDHLSRSGIDVLEHVEKISSRESQSNNGYIIKEYFKIINERERELLLIASILDWFDPRDISLIFDEKYGEDIVDNIVSFSIVKPKLEMYDAWKIHKAVREHAVKLIQNTDLATLKVLADHILEKYNSEEDINILTQYFNLLNFISTKNLVDVMNETINNLYSKCDLQSSIILLNWILNWKDFPSNALAQYAKLLEAIGLVEEAIRIYREIVDDSNSTDLEKIIARTSLARILYAKGMFLDAANMLKVNLEQLEKLPLNQETLLEKLRCYFILSKTLIMVNRDNEALRYIELLRNSYRDFTSLDKSILEEQFGLKLQSIYINSLYLLADLLMDKDPDKFIDIAREIVKVSRDYLDKYFYDMIIIRTFSRIIISSVNYLIKAGELDTEMDWISDNMAFLENIINKTISKSIDPITLRNLFTVYEKVGDFYLSVDNYKEASIYYNKIYEISNRIDLASHDYDLVIFKVKIAPKIARILIRNNDKSGAADLLIKARGTIENLIRSEFITRDIWISYFNILKRLGKVYNRLNNYEKAIGILNKAIGVANSIIAQYGLSIIPISDYLDTFRDLFRANIETNQFQAALQILNKVKEIFNETLLKDNYWKETDNISVLLKITRILRQKLSSPKEFISQATLILKEILINLFDTLTVRKELPENIAEYFGSLTWITITLAKMWYSLSMFNELYKLIEKAINAILNLVELVDEETKVILKSYKFNLRLRRAIARFFSELGIEQVEEDLAECRNILAEIEGKYDPIELAYMKCSLILFDSRIKNSLKQFDQSIINMRDFISIISSIPPKQLNQIKAREIFNRAYKALKDIKILTRGKIDHKLRETIIEIENEIRSLRRKFISS